MSFFIGSLSRLNAQSKALPTHHSPICNFTFFGQHISQFNLYELKLIILTDTVSLAIEAMCPKENYTETPFYLYKEPDLTLIVGNEKAIFKVHEYVLAPQSGFFKAALTIGTKESRLKAIELPELQEDDVSDILRWLYRVELWAPKRFSPYKFSTKNNDQKFLEAIDYLQIPKIARDYAKILNSKILAGYHEINISGCFARFLNTLYRVGGWIEPDVLRKLFPGKKDRWASVFYFHEEVLKMEDPDTAFLKMVGTVSVKWLPD
ncbi:hypothetical protein H072_3948 [Dactylellina haptotyla CBS 200.50]|uniref:BTB domain-containing protein n=1 Tax=Dactylellina haptotyla (strain CBS 200.50) TaxID=1284197 RepID=S8C387_DACHA|nr:hypothetical protein H072_3948 [Dactylellina haptotyla CBS 200.50]